MNAKEIIEILHLHYGKGKHESSWRSVAAKCVAKEIEAKSKEEAEISEEEIRRMWRNNCSMTDRGEVMTFSDFAEAILSKLKGE